MLGRLRWAGNTEGSSYPNSLKAKSDTNLNLRNLFSGCDTNFYIALNKFIYFIYFSSFSFKTILTQHFRSEAVLFVGGCGGVNKGRVSLWFLAGEGGRVEFFYFWLLLFAARYIWNLNKLYISMINFLKQVLSLLCMLFIQLRP